MVIFTNFVVMKTDSYPVVQANISIRYVAMCVQM